MDEYKHSFKRTFVRLTVSAFVCAAVLFSGSFPASKVEVQTAVIEGTVGLERVPASRSGVTIGGYSAVPSVSDADSDPDGDGGGIIVWLENQDPDESYGHGEDSLPVLNQVDKRFQPRLMAIRSGSSVRIVNSDPFYHNVFSLSGRNRFNVGYRTPEDSDIVLFEHDGVVDIFCDIHPGMHAVILVLPRQAVSWQRVDESGTYRFENVPPGEYILHYYAINRRQESAEVAVRGSETITMATLSLGGE